MAMLKVLLNQKGAVVGTARAQVTVSGTGGPEAATLVARSGQRLIEVEVDEKTASLDPEKLHALVNEKYARPGKGKPAVTRGTTRSKAAGGAKVTKARRSKAG